MSPKSPAAQKKKPTTKKDAVVTAAKKAASLKRKPQVKKSKVHHSTRFYQPKTLRLPRNPRVPLRSREPQKKWDDYRVIRSPLTTEKSIGLIESANTLTFLCDPRANKPQIKAAVQRLFNTRVARVNTLIRLQGDKKAYVRLHAEEDALDVANRIGMV